MASLNFESVTVMVSHVFSTERHKTLHPTALTARKIKGTELNIRNYDHTNMRTSLHEIHSFTPRKCTIPLNTHSVKSLHFMFVKISLDVL